MIRGLKLAVLLSVLAHQTAYSQTQRPADFGLIDYPVNNPVPIGEGWNWVKNRGIKASCIKGGVAEYSGSIVQLAYQRVVDTASIMHSLSVNTAAKAAFIAGSANASASFSNSVETTGYHEMVIATVAVSNSRASSTALGGLTALPGGEVDFPGGKILPIATNSAAVEIAKEHLKDAKNNPRRFRQRCGDGFVGMVSLGGILTVLYDFDARTEDERREIRANAAGRYGSYSGSTSMAATLKKFESRNQLKIFYARSGGGSGTPLPITLAELDDEIGRFAADVAARPLTTTLSVIPYTEVSNWPASGPDSRIHC